MPYSIILKEKLEQSDVLEVGAPLQRFNNENGPATEMSAVVLQVLDAEGNVGGGLFGRIAYDWMHIEILVVPESARGQGLGRSLMQQAEAIAIQRGCTGVYLDTLAFQARGFYEKLGYEVFGTLEDRPKGGTHFFLQKRLMPSQQNDPQY